ncbi:MAG: NAD-binding protein, partial [Selenomonas sp.]|nr:NAD-binding protein [Selenomonas sp.]
MRIVVAGAGQLGYSIASLLSEEGMDVVVVDGVSKQLEAAKTTLDVLTVEANIASPIT